MKVETSTSSTRGVNESTLREVVEALAVLERRAGSPGEQQAAEWIVERLREHGCSAAIEEAQFRDGYANVIGLLTGASALAGAAAFGRRTRKVAAATAAAAATAIADDISNGPRLIRRAFSQARTTWNVVGQCGDERSSRALVVLAHHDAAPTGVIFDERPQVWLAEQFPGIIERIDTSLPLWWPVLAGPALVALGAARGKRGLVAAGLAGSVLSAGVFADVARSPVTPGANDNLTAVAVLIALAQRLEAEPLEGLRVVLVSTGAEEVLQGGIHGFAARHFAELPRERTWFLNLETVGSPRLILLEGEGPVVMEDYPDRAFRDLVARAADGAGASLRRGMRSRASTDAVIPTRAGYATATLTSMDRYKSLSNYHQMSDTPENVDYTTVLQSLTVAEAVARELAANPWIGR